MSFFRSWSRYRRVTLAHGHIINRLLSISWHVANDWNIYSPPDSMSWGKTSHWTPDLCHAANKHRTIFFITQEIIFFSYSFDNTAKIWIVTNQTYQLLYLLCNRNPSQNLLYVPTTEVTWFITTRWAIFMLAWAPENLVLFRFRMVEASGYMILQRFQIEGISVCIGYLENFGLICWNFERIFY